MNGAREEEGRGRRTGILRRLWGLIRRHPYISSSAGVIAAGLVVFALVWFQPQKLFINKTVNEPLPGVTGSAPAGSPGQRSSPPLQVLRSGAFRGLEHPTTGAAVVLRRPGGGLILRLQQLSTSNGPDLRVYLSRLAASGDPNAYGEKFTDIGALKGNRGNQNYAIPAGTDLAAIKSVVVWCRRFTVGFGVAPLRP